MLTPSTEADFKAHALRESPKECCGVVVTAHGRQHYVPCANVAEDPLHDFALDEADFAAASDLGLVVAICHSHAAIGTADTFTPADRVAVEFHKLPWFLYVVRTGEMHETRPCGYRPPLIGRAFCFGVLDCYTLVRDYYQEVHGITLNDYPRRFGFEDRGEELYLDNFKREGFHEIEEKDLRPGDAILMKVLSPVTNHAAIYLGDGIILHHALDCLSARQVYGGFMRKCSAYFLRHRELC